MAVITYNPEGCSVLFNGVPIAGWDSFEVTPAEERWNLESSTDGLTSHRKNPHRGGKGKITISEESWENQVMALLRGSLDAEFTYTVIDASGTNDGSTGESCHITQQPNFRRGKDKVTADVDINIGILHYKSTAG